MTLTISAPGSVGNLGPGFDVLGAAVSPRIVLHCEPAEHFSLENRSLKATDAGGQGSSPAGTRTREDLVETTIVSAFRELQMELPGFAITVESEIPFDAGMGSSAAALVCAFAAVAAMQGQTIDRDVIFHRAAQTEGHPDNVAAAVYGGITIAPSSGNPARIEPVPDLSVVIFVPEMSLPTKAARAVLPPTVDRAAAVHNLGNTALLVWALLTNQNGRLRQALEDQLHQDARYGLYPFVPGIMSAATAAGALGACLSGAGPSVCALVTGGVDRVAAAMEEQGRATGTRGRAIHCQIDRPGLTVQGELV